jgi:hypothetical protein
MYIPMVHEHVRAAGRRGVFVVTFADYDRQAADLRDVANPQVRERCVPFEQLFAVWEVAPQPMSNNAGSASVNNA